MTRIARDRKHAAPRLAAALLAAAALAAGCRTAADGAGPGGAGAMPAPIPAPPSAPPAFEARVLPLLRERCSPCHFPGGSMHDRLPFDHEGTVRDLGRRLFTRIEDEEGRAILEEFLAVAPTVPSASSGRRRRRRRPTPGRS